MLGQEVLASSVFLAGILSFFSPCIFPILPVYIGILSDEDGEYKKIKIGRHSIALGALLKTISFVLGLGLSFVFLGFGAGFIGKFLLNRYVIMIAGLIVVIIGIHQMGIIHLKFMDKMPGFGFQSDRTGALGTFLMGVSFSIGWTPCIGPVLASVLALSATGGTAWYGAYMMLIYTLGLMLPFLIIVILKIAASAVLDKQLAKAKKHLTLIKRIGGALIVIIGLLIMFNQVNTITAFMQKIFN